MTTNNLILDDVDAAQADRKSEMNATIADLSLKLKEKDARIKELEEAIRLACPSRVANLIDCRWSVHLTATQGEFFHSILKSLEAK